MQNTFNKIEEEMLQNINYLAKENDRLQKKIYDQSGEIQRKAGEIIRQAK